MNEAVGDCFEVAYRMAVHLDATLVHGLPIGQGPRNQGKRFWHAWAELDVHGLVVVIDYANNNSFVELQPEYYRIGNLDEDHVFRYTIVEAQIEMVRSEVWGPWVEHWDTLNEV